MPCGLPGLVLAFEYTPDRAPSPGDPAQRWFAINGALRQDGSSVLEPAGMATLGNTLSQKWLLNVAGSFQWRARIVSINAADTVTWSAVSSLTPYNTSIIIGVQPTSSVANPGAGPVPASLAANSNLTETGIWDPVTQTFCQQLAATTDLIGTRNIPIDATGLLVGNLGMDRLREDMISGPGSGAALVGNPEDRRLLELILLTLLRIEVAIIDGNNLSQDDIEGKVTMDDVQALLG
jgi:hypothetical protein